MSYKKEIFYYEAGEHWNRLPREVLDSPSLEVFKARLDETLSNMVWWKVSLPMAWVLELEDI